MAEEMKNILEEINSSLNDTEEQISDLKDKVVEITQAEQKTEKEFLKMKIVWDFPGGPVANAPHSQCRGHRV